MALIASSVSGKVARRLTGTTHEHDFIKMEERMEELAIGVLVEADAQETAFQVLREGATMTPDPSISGNRNLLDLAGSLGRKKFVNVSHCQAIMDRWWRCAHHKLEIPCLFLTSRRVSIVCRVLLPPLR